MPEKLSRKAQIAYAWGGLGKNLAYGIVASYTLYYYNTVLGMSGSFIGSMLMLARIFDAFNDPIMGVIVARTESRWGRFKPWIFTGTLLNALVLIAMFAVPEGLSVSNRRIYVTVTYLLCGITYTLGDIPYWSIIPSVTVPGRERENMTTLARAFSGIGTAAPLVFTMAAVALLGGGMRTANYRTGFTRLAILIAVVFVATTMVMLYLIPREKDRGERRAVGVKTLLKSLLHNDMALSVAALIVLFYSATYLTSNLVVYVFRYDIGSELWYTPYMAITGVAQFLALTAGYMLLRRRFSNRQIFFIACFAGILGYVLLFAMSFTGKMTILKLVPAGVLIGGGMGLAYVLTTILIADSVDYGERKTGQREESMVSSLQTLMVKLSAAFGSFIAGIGIDLAHLSQASLDAGTSGIMTLRMLFALPSMLLMGLAILVLWRKKAIGAPVERVGKKQE